MDMGGVCLHYSASLSDRGPGARGGRGLGDLVDQ